MKQFAFLIIGIITGLLSSCGEGNVLGGEEIHFSQEQNWTGEPAGLVYHNGKYHLFYQCNPSDVVSGNISWGHAVSTDLIRWEECPVAIAADENGQVYSGSVIVDKDNTSGLGTADHPVFIAYYTRYKPKQGTDSNSSPYSVGTAYSRDEGMTWTDIAMEWEDGSDNKRYPNVCWNKQIDAWVMTVSTGRTIRFYFSPDAIHWKSLNEFGGEMEITGSWENSTLSPLKIEGSNDTKWVLFINVNEGVSDGAPGTRYFIGDFNNSGFHMTQSKELWVDYGKDNYGGILCNNLPDDRTVMVGWMNCWLYANLTPQTGKRGSITFPRELALAYEGNNYTLCSKPVRELTGLYGKTREIENTEIAGIQTIFNKRSVSRYPFVIHLVFDASDRYAMWHPREYGIRLRTASGGEITFAYRAEMNYYYVDRSRLSDTSFSEDYTSQLGAAYRVNPPADEWYILVDQGSAEWFAGDNKVAITSLCFTDEAIESIDCYTESGYINLKEASLISIEKKTNK